MITDSSDLAPVTSCGAGEKAFPYMSRDESQAIIQALTFELSVQISRRLALLKASSEDPAQWSEDIAALAWIQRTLEDVEATIIGLAGLNHPRSEALQGADLSYAARPFP